VTGSFAVARLRVWYMSPAALLHLVDNCAVCTLRCHI